MKMPQNNPTSLWSTLKASGDPSGRFVMDADSRIAMSDLVEGSVLYGRRKELRAGLCF
jgi:hypothetical protein